MYYTIESEYASKMIIEKNNNKMRNTHSAVKYLR